MAAKSKDGPNHKAFFVSLKNLWLSFLNNATRERFAESDQEISRFFVSTSVFLDQFWPTVPNQIQRTVSGERAWFGIRSIMNGGRIGHKTDEFTEEHFAQLNPLGGEIHRSETKDFYNDDELRAVIQTQRLYTQWKRSHEKYDELDIVRAAYHSYAGVEHDPTDKIREIRPADKDAIETLIRMSMQQDIMLSANIERFLRKNRDNHSLFDSLKKYIIKVRERNTQQNNNQRPKLIHVGNTISGVNVYKAKITKAYRVLFSYVANPNFNSTKPFVLLRTICHTNDQETEINKICNSRTKGETEVDFKDINHDDVRSLPLLDVDGPLKPVAARTALFGFEDLFDPNNICLDSNQINALADNVPLLIDGLAGTGKTAILAARGAIRLAPPMPPTSILVTASMPHVVTRISDGIKKRTQKHRADGSVMLDLNYCGIESDIGSNRTVEEFAEFFPTYGFDEIILDECQDLMFLEFEVLSRITKGKNPRRFAIAGDPMQTLNPTGFDWNKIVALFRDKGVRGEYTKPSKFHMNYRSQSNVVHLANGIQRIREKATSSTGVIMESRRSPLDAKPYLILIEDEKDVKDLKKLIRDSGKGQNDAIVICWATDDAALLRMLENEDELLKETWNDLRTDDYDEVDGFRTKFLVHSSSSIKGDEQSAVVLYKFASNPEARTNLSSMLLDFDEILPVSADEKIAVDYAFSRLYVAVTRAFDHVFIIEDKDGFDFWKSVKFVDEDGRSLNLFEETNRLGSVIASRQDVFMVSEETTIANFHKNRKKWDEESNVDGLKIAVNIGEQLLKEIDNKEVEHHWWRLRGDLSWRNYKLANTENDRKHHLSKALEAFEKAGLPERIAPIRFEQKEWLECRRLMRENSPFAKLIRIFCSIQLEDEIKQTEVLSLDKKNLPRKSPHGWDISPSSVLAKIKDEMLERQFDFSEFDSPNAFIFEHRDWFGVNNILSFIVRKRFECKLLVDLWNDTEAYHEASSDLFARSLRKSLSPGLDGIDELDDYRRRFPKLDSKLINPTIERRREWLFQAVDEGSPVNDPNGTFFAEFQSLNFNSLITMRKDNQLEGGVREKASALYHAKRLYDDLQTAGKDAKSEFKDRSRILDVLTLMQEYDWLHDPLLHTNMDPHLQLSTTNSVFEFFMYAGQMINAAPMEKRSRFAWLNDHVYIEQLVRAVDKAYESYANSHKVGFERVNYYGGRLFYHMKYYNIVKGGRKSIVYETALKTLGTYEPSNKNYITKLWEPYLDYLTQQEVADDSLSDFEFDFIINSLRYNQIEKLKKNHLSIKPKIRKSLFDEEMRKRYELEELRLKFKWPYIILDGGQLKKKPKKSELDMYRLALKDLSMESDLTMLMNAIPKDPDQEMQRFDSIKSYAEFWKLLSETKQSFNEFEKLVEKYGLPRWITIINQLEWLDQSIDKHTTRVERFDCIQPILKLCEFEGLLGTEKEHVQNGLFFLQFTEGFDYFLNYRNYALADGITLEEQDITLLYGTVKNYFDRIAPNSTPGKTLDELKKQEEERKRFQEMVDAIFAGFDVETMYLNRIAGELFGKTLKDLNEFSKQYNLDVKSTQNKKTAQERIFVALGISDTAVARYFRD